MRNFNPISLLLLVCAVLITVFLGGREINEKIEETIKNNYQTEIDALKEKLNKQGELINSMIKNTASGNSSSGEGDSNGNSSGSSASGSGSSGSTSNTVSDNSTDQSGGFTYIKENGGITITGYTGKLTSPAVPERIEGLSVLKIGKRAFAETSIRSITLPSSCEEIDWFAFYGCYALNTVYISGSVEVIGYGAFESCSKALVIYCESDSYAEKYARSFGIAYEHIS